MMGSYSTLPKYKKQGIIRQKTKEDQDASTAIKGIERTNSDKTPKGKETDTDTIGIRNKIIVGSLRDNKAL